MSNLEQLSVLMSDLKFNFGKEKKIILKDIQSVEDKINKFVLLVEDSLNDKSFKSINKLLLDIEEVNVNFDFIDEFNNNYSELINDVYVDMYAFSDLLNNERISRVFNHFNHLKNKYNIDLDIQFKNRSKTLEGIEIFYKKQKLIDSSFYLDEVNVNMNYIENKNIDYFMKECSSYLEKEVGALIEYDYSDKYLEFSRKEYSVITFETYSILDELTNKFNKEDAINLRGKTFLVNQNILNFLNKNNLPYIKEEKLNLSKNKYFDKKENAIYFEQEEHSEYKLNPNGLLEMQGPKANLKDFIDNVPINFV